MRYQIRIFLFFLILFTLNKTSAQQVCQGALGDPVININFGSGNNYGPAVPSSGYPYVTRTPNDGQYTVANSTRGLNNNWFIIDDHTPDDIDGYMMVINADNNLGVFYQTTIKNLCPGTKYEFAAWIVNILKYTSTETKPNVTFTIENSSGTVYTYNTNDIPETASPEWKQYAMLFQTGNESEIILKITNNGARGNGNDIALDDITFRACGPTIIPSIGDLADKNLTICEGTTGSYELSAEVSPVYVEPAYQWQINSGNGWTDINGATLTETTISLNNLIPGVYQYRLVAAEKQNIESVNCRVASSPLVITVNAKPNTIASSNGPVCVGANIQLSATEGDTFSWTGPNFTSTDKSPLINNAQLNMSGVYTVTATLNGCITTASTNVLVLEPVNASTSFNSVPICEGASMPLSASGGTVYKWFPIEGLSRSDIANPIATPKETTIYKVTVSNGACSATATSEVVVIKNAVANAGADVKIINGQSVTLNGKVSGDNVRYFWSPPEYLDDVTKLNPVATPPSDKTYTLNAISNSGCLSSIDDVFIKVYPKIVIPNSFTPNGDGVNDTWIIPVADAFPNAKVRIVNRTGSLLYQSNGAYKAWDGKFEGKDLPVGTYYYTIYFNEDFQVFSGWIFLTR